MPVAVRFLSRFFIHICVLSVIADSCFAALDDLPLIGEKFPVTISVDGNKDLAKAAESALKTQRKESAEFHNINRLRAAGRFDRDIILRWLRSESYFGGTLNTRFEN